MGEVSKDSFMVFCFSCKYIDKFRNFVEGGGELVCMCHICCVLKTKTLFGCISTKMLVLNFTFRVKVTRTPDWHRNDH